ncbi:hypothetical protein DAEQUDRAFT_458396 [Daedalea quercina L-15889]|uniref:Uncharacterized protein n=1 Tax=Daedalea quercina L-15889 TaxID=1314783 RepID=A0A165N212_9APHY|nr:hypothetical protein DAEQUDRAFT_458396 [Daedalea quercina L-15889]
MRTLLPSRPWRLHGARSHTLRLFGRQQYSRRRRRKNDLRLRFLLSLRRYCKRLQCWSGFLRTEYIWLSRVYGLLGGSALHWLHRGWRRELLSFLGRLLFLERRRTSSSFWLLPGSIRLVVESGPLGRTDARYQDVEELDEERLPRTLRLRIPGARLFRGRRVRALRGRLCILTSDGQRQFQTGSSSAEKTERASGRGVVPA